MNIIATSLFKKPVNENFYINEYSYNEDNHSLVVKFKTGAIYKINIIELGKDYQDLLWNECILNFNHDGIWVPFFVKEKRTHRGRPRKDEEHTLVKSALEIKYNTLYSFGTKI